MFRPSLTPSTYRHDPTRAAATSWWKIAHNALPDGVKIVHESEDKGMSGREHINYFKMIRDFENLKTPTLPEGYTFVDIFSDSWIPQIVEMINACYPEIQVDDEEVATWHHYPVASADLWLGVTDSEGTLVASGIAERDASVGELSMDWVQVAKPARGKGIGQAIIWELLRRAAGTADYATVSGRVRTTSHPDHLYESAGFRQKQIWHIYMPTH